MVIVSEAMLRTLLVLTVAPSLIAQEEPVTAVQNPVPTAEIKRVLVLARDAALNQERADPGQQGGFLPGYLQTLMAGFRTIDDWQDAVVLQKRVTSIHKVDVLYAPPHATAADFRKVQAAAQHLGKYDRDNGLRRIIGQELADGFFDEAEQVAASISDARTQSDAYTDLAVFSWKRKKKDDAHRCFQAAIDSALKIQEPYGGSNSTESQAQQLRTILTQRYSAGDKSGALDTLSHLHGMLVSSEGYLHNTLCGIFVGAQAEVGLFEEARSSATCFSREEERKSTEDYIAYQETSESEPAKAVSKALNMEDAGSRLGLLAELGFNQAEAGNQADALTALDEAMKAFPLLQPLDYPPHGPAYTLRRIAVGYLYAGARDKGEVVLRRLRDLKEATPSTRDQYDMLYDLAVGYASFAFFDEAHGFIGEMGEYPNEQACNVVAYLESKQGQAEQAVQWSSQLKDPAARTGALVGIVEAMLEINQ